MKRTNAPTDSSSPQKPSLLLEALRSDGFLSINKKLLKEHGPDCAVFLSHLLTYFEYFRTKNKLIDGEWFYQKHSMIEEETGMTEYKIRASKKYWEEKNILDTKMKGVPAKMHYRIDWNALEHEYLMTCPGDFRRANHGESRRAIYNKNKINNNKINNTHSDEVDGRLFDVDKNTPPYEKTVWSWFDKFWDHYPRKEAKQKAKDRWKQIFITGPKKNRPTLNEVVNGIEKQAPALAQREKQYIPHASTWLNQKRWKEDPEEVGGKHKKGSAKSAHREQNKKYKTDLEI